MWRCTSALPRKYGIAMSSGCRKLPLLELLTESDAWKIKLDNVARPSNPLQLNYNQLKLINASNFASLVSSYWALNIQTSLALPLHSSSVLISLGPEDFNPQKQILFILHLSPQLPALNFCYVLLQWLFISRGYLILRCFSNFFLSKSLPPEDLLHSSILTCLLRHPSCFICSF